MKRLSVFLADVRYYHQGVLSTDSMPLNVANLKAVMDRDLPEVDSRVFAYPDDLLEAIRAQVPDVMLLSNYIWNEALSLHFARLVKSLNPNALTVMGGPNFFIEDNRKVEYMEAHPYLDIHVAGEGDFTATEIVKKYIGAGCDPYKTTDQEIENSVYKRAGEVYIGVAEKRRRDLDEIPSPWLTGIMDQFFDGKLVPIFETNRGCPFTCTFCVQGGRWWSKVNYFGMDRIKEELFYIADRIKMLSPNQKVLRLADLNYGMYERDVQISEWMGEIQKEYDWPLLIDATTGKNQAERIIRSIEKVNGALVMYQAVQSLDEDVLQNVKRTNIDLDTYEKIQIHVRGRGLRSSSDMILGLPGETFESHLRSIAGLINSGTHRLHNFQAIMLKGSELETLASREKYGFETRFRLGPKNFGRYADGEKVIGMEEVIVSTNTLSFDEYLEARKYHFATAVFWNTSRLVPLVQWCNAYGLSNWDWLNSIVEELDKYEGTRDLLEKFAQETQDELFESKEAFEAFYFREEIFRGLENNEYGDNLIYKYKGFSSFVAWACVCECAIGATRKLIGDLAEEANDCDLSEFWKDLCTWLTMRHAHGSTPDSLLSSEQGEFHYDMQAWLEEDCPKVVLDFRCEEVMTVRFALSAENEKNLRAALNVIEFEPRSFSMLVRRVHNSWQIRTPEGILEERLVAPAG